MLNGKKVFLRGICIHEENPLRGGRAWSEDDARLLLGWAKELNCNFVRLAHYPHNEHMARLADEMGIMVLGGNSGLLDDSMDERGHFGEREKTVERLKFYAIKTAPA